jgi:hypothetical protein
MGQEGLDQAAKTYLFFKPSRQQKALADPCDVVKPIAQCDECGMIHWSYAQESQGLSHFAYGQTCGDCQALT